MELVAVAAVGAVFALVALFRGRKRASALASAAADAIASHAPTGELLALAAQCRAAGDLDTAHKLETAAAGVAT